MKKMDYCDILNSCLTQICLSKCHSIFHWGFILFTYLGVGIWKTSSCMGSTPRFFHRPKPQSMMQLCDIYLRAIIDIPCFNLITSLCTV